MVTKKKKKKDQKKKGKHFCLILPFYELINITSLSKITDAVIKKTVYPKYLISEKEYV